MIYLVTLLYSFGPLRLVNILFLALFIYFANLCWLLGFRLSGPRVSWPFVDYGHSWVAARISIGKFLEKGALRPLINLIVHIS